MEIPGYWVSTPRNDGVTYSNIYNDGRLDWVIIHINREGSLMLAENPVNKYLSIWAAKKDFGTALGVSQESTASNKSPWLCVTVVENNWLLSMNGAMGAHFDALGDLQGDDPKLIRVDVLVERSDMSHAWLRIDSYVRPGEVIVTSEWKVDPNRVHDAGRVESATAPLLQKIKAQAFEIHDFLVASKICVFFNNPRGYIRRDFYCFFNDSAALQPTLLLSADTQSNGDGNDDAGGSGGSSQQDQASVMVCDEGGGVGKKRTFFEVEGMSTGASVRGRRPGSKDTKKRERGSHLSKKDKIDIFETLTKLIILERKNCDKPSESKDDCNRNICALFSITNLFDVWYPNKTSTLLYKRFEQMLEIINPLLEKCPLLLSKIPIDFAESVKDDKTMEIYVGVKERIVQWYRAGSKNDFFAKEICNDPSTVGNPANSDWLKQNRLFLLERGVMKLRKINHSEMERRQPLKLAAEDIVDSGAKTTLTVLKERLALSRDKILREIKNNPKGDLSLDGPITAESQESDLKMTYCRFDSVLNKAVEVCNETNELTERLKILEQKRQELVSLFNATSQRSAAFTRTYLPHSEYVPENDVQSFVENILADASRNFISAPQFSGGAAGGQG